jgi:hypothetical protein
LIRINCKEGQNLNNKQRIVLIIGAASFLYVLFTSPKISIIKGTYVTPPSDKKDIARIVDVYTAMARAVAVLGATLLVSIALKDKKGTRTQSTMETEPFAGEHCQESKRQLVKKGTYAKILRFLKDFFLGPSENS